MKIISIVSSGRKNGNTARIVKHLQEAVLQQAVKKNILAEFEQIDLANSNIQFCMGCRVCFDKGEALCPLKDSLLAVRNKIDQADGVIFASPVYVEDVNGIMKNWIDRMAFNCHRPAFAGKAAAIITNSGVGSSNHALKTIKSALLTWGFSVAVQSKFRTGALITEEQLNIRYGNKIKTVAGKLFNTIYRKRAEYPSFYSLMVFKVQQRYWLKTKNELNTYDYLYWKRRGWLEATCNYYINHKAGFVKVKLAGIAGYIISLFFI